MRTATSDRPRGAVEPTTTLSCRVISTGVLDPQVPWLKVTKSATGVYDIRLTPALRRMLSVNVSTDGAPLGFSTSATWGNVTDSFTVRTYLGSTASDSSFNLTVQGIA